MSPVWSRMRRRWWRSSNDGSGRVRLSHGGHLARARPIEIRRGRWRSRLTSSDDLQPQSGTARQAFESGGIQLADGTAIGVDERSNFVSQNEWQNKRVRSPDGFAKGGDKLGIELGRGSLCRLAVAEGAAGKTGSRVEGDRLDRVIIVEPVSTPPDGIPALDDEQS